MAFCVALSAGIRQRGAGHGSWWTDGAVAIVVALCLLVVRKHVPPSPSPRTHAPTHRAPTHPPTHAPLPQYGLRTLVKNYRANIRWWRAEFWRGGGGR